MVLGTPITVHYTPWIRLWDKKNGKVFNVLRNAWIRNFDATHRKYICIIYRLPVYNNFEQIFTQNIAQKRLQLLQMIFEQKLLIWLKNKMK